MFRLVLLALCWSSISLSAKPIHPEKLKEIETVTESAIKRGDCPGAVVLVIHQDEVIYRKAFGNRSLKPEVQPMTEETIFDMASITKPLATASSIWLLIEQGKLKLTDRVSKYWPEFAQKGKEVITVEQCLLHTTGLTADNALSDYKEGKEKAIENVAKLSLEAEPGTRFRYSDVGFIVLGVLVEKVSGESLDTFARKKVFEPLGMKETGFLPGGPLRERCAPTTEKDNKWLIGEVHDPRSFAMKGVAGHAGLFGSADDLARYCRMLMKEGELDGKRIFSPLTVRLLTTPISVSGGKRSRGWDVDTSYSAQRGEVFRKGEGFGHTGFTGTSIWIDLPTKTAIIILTNRVHPNEKGNVTRLRREIGSIVASAVQNTSEKAKSPEFRSTLTGIDVLVKEKFARLKGKKVGLVTNHTGRDRNGTQTIDLLHQAPGVKLVALFSPEHGIRGAKDEKIDDSKDEKTGLPIYSLYGKRTKPTKETLEGIDTLIYDIQDIGCRFYTYISTMGHILEAANEHQLKVIILDRPNPIGGLAVEGPVRDSGKESFVAYHSLPIRHGMTLGELATMYKVERKLDVDLEIVKMEGWRRSDFLDHTGLTWVNPSPNMRTLTAALLYPGIGLFETTNISVGRGTERPFEWIGAPWMDGQKVAEALNPLQIPGVRFVPTNLTPISSTHQGKRCGGVQIIVDDWKQFQPVRTGLKMALEIRKLYPDDWNIKSYDRLLVHNKTWEAVKNLQSISEIENLWQEDLKSFQERRKSYLLYSE